MAAVGAEAERVDHHPDLDLRYTHVDVRLWSHDAGGVTGRDLRLARTIAALAADAGLTPCRRPGWPAWNSRWTPPSTPWCCRSGGRS
ncbi:4a-hydroxytetrahydrobiopterin dehydratase [Micromonospora sp. BRA006-A]|nr:4a-hydroxytetrahydrobiopterin dehydratase [Micromonospora sp. BRA006-A]